MSSSTDDLNVVLVRVHVEVDVYFVEERNIECDAHVLVWIAKEDAVMDV